jgi:anionic cell wall polymer biosynthesis LytR-Cps2A-Psr (LCP) family protein
MAPDNQKGSIFFLTLILLLSAAGIILLILAMRRNPAESALSGDRVVKILFVVDGSNKGTVRPLGSYVFMYYPGTERAAVFDIPGNIGMLVQRTDRYDRIDTLYNRRNLKPYMDAIGQLLDADIDFHFCISLADLGKAVDLLDGVTIFIPTPVSVYGGTKGAKANLFFPAGLANLDGNKARAYFNYILPDEGEDSRTLRRQRFFAAFISRMAEDKEAFNDKSLRTAFLQLLDTDIDQKSFAHILDDLAGSESSRMSIQTVQGNSRVVSGQSLIFPYYNGSQIKEIVRSAQGSLTQTVEGALGDRIYTVEVLNGSGVSGIAGRAGELLRSFGYDVISVANAPTMDYSKTEIIDRSGQANAAKALGDIIRCGNIETEKLKNENAQDYEYQSDFTLIIGKDFDGRYVSKR